MCPVGSTLRASFAARCEAPLEDTEEETQGADMRKDDALPSAEAFDPMTDIGDRSSTRH